jgi:hypothetical protein
VPFYEDLNIDSRDDKGHYCGESVVTGEFIQSSPDVVGYCGPHCTHCVDFRVYSIQDGVYVCAADYDPNV